MRNLVFVLQKLLVFYYLDLPKLSRGIKLRAINAGELPKDIGYPSAIYDGTDSIFIFGMGNLDEDRSSATKDIFRYDISTSNVSKVDEIRETVMFGMAQIDRLRNIFYFDRTGIYEINSTTNKIVSVIPIAPELRDVAPMKYNESQLLFVTKCEQFWSFDLNTRETRKLGNFSLEICSGLSFLSMHTFCPWNNRITIVENFGKIFYLDLDTFQSVMVSQAFSQNFTNLSGVCKDQYIYNLGSLKSESNQSIAMSQFNMETYELTYFEIDNVPYLKNLSVLDPPAGVFVKELNRIYFFGGHSHDTKGVMSGGREIFYLDLAYLTNESNEITATEGWIWSLTVSFALALILAFGFVFRSKKSNVTVAIPMDLVVGRKLATYKEKYQPFTVWKSKQSCWPTSLMEIGAGSFSKVYRAVDSLQPGMFYAVKQISLYKAMDHMNTWEIEKVFREVHNLLKIDNENVVKLFNFWVEDHDGIEMNKENQLEILQFHEWSPEQNHFLYLQMELCDSTLEDWLKTHTTLDSREETEVKNILGQIVNGLRGIHAKGIIHRDIKPNNIFYCKNPNLWKIGDLGVSIKTQDILSDLTIIGCGSYMSPEMASGIDYDNKSDVFSLGLTFLEIIHVFEDEFTRMARFDKIREGEIDAHEITGFLLFPEIAELIFKMLITDPNFRIDIFDDLFEVALIMKGEMKTSQ